MKGLETERLGRGSPSPTMTGCLGNGYTFFVQMSNEENPGWLGSTGGHTTLCYRIYYIPLQESLLNSQ